MAAVREYGQPLVDDEARLDEVDTVGVDETAFLAATALSGTRFATGIVALNGRARLLDVVEGRSGTALCGLGFRPLAGVAEWGAGGCVGPDSRLRRRAAHLAAERHRDAGRISTSSGSASTRSIRSAAACKQDTLGHRGYRDDPLFRIRWLLRRGYEHHSPRSWNRMIAGIEAGDVDAQVQRAWIAAQELRLFYLETAHWGRAAAAAQVHRYRPTRDPELLRPARTLDTWRIELLDYFDTDGVSNGQPRRSR